MPSFFAPSDLIEVMGTLPPGVSSERTQIYLDAAVDLVSREVVRIGVAEKTEFPPGDPRGSAILIVEDFITSITTIHENADARWGSVDDTFTADDLLVSGEDYAADQRIRTQVLRLAAFWPRTAGAIRVVYQAGEWANKAALPTSLKVALIELAWHMALDGRKPGAIMSETIGKFSYTLGGQGAVDRKSAIGAACRVINGFRRMK